MSRISVCLSAAEMRLEHVPGKLHADVEGTMQVLSTVLPTQAIIVANRNCLLCGQDVQLLNLPCLLRIQMVSHVIVAY